MCRSIKQLRYKDAEPTDQELYDAALQFVRKVSGYRVPSKKNQDAFELAVEEIAAATRKLLQVLTPHNFAGLHTHDHSEPHTHTHTHKEHTHA